MWASLPGCSRCEIKLMYKKSCNYRRERGDSFVAPAGLVSQSSHLGLSCCAKQPTGSGPCAIVPRVPLIVLSDFNSVLLPPARTAFCHFHKPASLQEETSPCNVSISENAHDDGALQGPEPVSQRRGSCPRHSARGWQRLISDVTCYRRGYISCSIFSGLVYTSLIWLHHITV